MHEIKTTWSLRTRLALLAGGVMALVCLLVSALVVFGVRNRAADYRKTRDTQVALSVMRLIERRSLPPLLPEQDGISIQVLDSRGRVVSGTANLAHKPPMADFQPPESADLASRKLCPPRGLRDCMNVVVLRVYQSEGDWTVYTANRTIPWYVSSGTVVFLASISLLLVLLTAVGASHTVHKTLVPVEAIRAELAEITASDTGRRVPVPESHDEIRQLADTVNATLQRLDAALVQMRRFTSDASHDLRSPITAARAQVEEALRYPEETDWHEMATQVLASLDRLQAIVTDLLELTALDTGAHRAMDYVNLGTLVSAEIDRRPGRVPIHTHLDSDVIVRGDPLRLARLLVNLLDNAERYAASKVDIIVRSENGTAVLEVRDDGAGIPPEHRETVFQRFARLDTARNRASGGTGLGLPIARQTAHAHGGTLVAEDSPRGARLVLRLPQTTPPKPPG
ncbi:Signal transduction histidine kinase [Thermomonospora echinospora]|uniref:histidine kinase n=1 Tax=Thermomonospora echinospora TaxID=1992 RepID=A0A1H6E0P8_9ACTN|nr:HAMP domain-containing sensor histidine kinase [Thermomonospora echinospora]SEG91107.1 Signal transduction histidine kinase [Thermomonospora echinospora]